MRDFIIILVLFFVLVVPSHALAKDLWSHTIYKGIHPARPPKISLKVKLGSVRMRCKYVRSKVRLVVTSSSPRTSKIIKKIKQCGKNAVAAGGAAAVGMAILTGEGVSTGTTAANMTFKICMGSKISGLKMKLVSSSRRDKKWKKCLK